MAYSLDSSGILDLFRYYPPDVFPTLWTQMDSAASGGLVFAIDEVYRELEKKDDTAFQWLKARRVMVVAIDTAIQQHVASILAAHPRLIEYSQEQVPGRSIRDWPSPSAGALGYYRRTTFGGDCKTQHPRRLCDTGDNLHERAIDVPQRRLEGLRRFPPQLRKHPLAFRGIHLV